MDYRLKKSGFTLEEVVKEARIRGGFVPGMTLGGMRDIVRARAIEQLDDSNLVSNDLPKLVSFLLSGPKEDLDLAMQIITKYESLLANKIPMQKPQVAQALKLSLIHISEPTRLLSIS